jgi:hypothetical protein
VRLNDVAGDRQTEAGTAAQPRAALIEAHETVEDLRTVAGSDRRPIVADQQMSLPIRLRDGDRDGPAGVPDGIVDQVAHGPVQLLGVADDSDRFNAALDAEIRMLDSYPLALGIGQVVQIHLLEAQPQGVVVDARQQQQVVDQLAHPYALGLRSS